MRHDQLKESLCLSYERAMTTHRASMYTQKLGICERILRSREIFDGEINSPRSFKAFLWSLSRTKRKSL